MKLIRGCDTMDNKPFFIDEKELAALKKNMNSDTKTISVEKMQQEEEKPIFAEETKNEELEKTSTDLVVTKPTDIQKKEKAKDKPKFEISLQLFTTIMASIIVFFLLISVARSFYYGFKYYDCAHVNYNCDEDTNTQK